MNRAQWLPLVGLMVTSSLVAEEPKLPNTLNGHTGAVLSVAFSPDGKTLASGAADCTIKLWEIATRKNIATFIGNPKVVYCVAYSPDGGTLASGSPDSCKLWDVTTGKNTATFDSETCTVAFSPNGKTLATNDADKAIKLWNVATGKSIATLNGHADFINSVAFSPDGKTLASASDDNTVKLWDVVTSRCIATFSGHTKSVFFVAFGPLGDTLASVGADSTVRLWDVATGRNTVTLTGQDPICSVAFSVDGKVVASGSVTPRIKDDTILPWDATDQHRINLWDVATGKNIVTLSAEEHTPVSLDFGPDGNTLASGGFDSCITLWDLNVAKEADK